MKNRKCFITLNHINGWKVVLDYKYHIDCTKPIFNSDDITETGLSMCKSYCKNNDLEVIRICQ